MSVIGEVASIAGIIELAGQTLRAASSVYSLLKAYKRVHPRILEIQEEISRLQEVLQVVARLNSLCPNPMRSDLANLHRSVLKCGPVLEKLKIQMLPLEATSAGFFGKLLKKVKVAADVEYFSIISHQIHLCRADVSLHLGLLQSTTGLLLCEQANNATIALDEVKERQAVTSHTLLIESNDIRADIADARSEQRLVLSSLSRKVDWLTTERTTDAGMTPGDLALMDARLRLLENRLAESMQPRKATPRTPVTQPPEGEAKVEEIPVRLIKPGILNYEENGRIISELIPIDDRKATKMDSKARLDLIRRVQGLRILLWLMRQNNYRSSVPSSFSMIPRSSLTRQAKVTSLWQFCYSCTELGRVLRNPQLNMSSAIPWIACERWLKYLCDRQQDCKEIMEPALQQWGHDSQYLIVPKQYPTFFRSRGVGWIMRCSTPLPSFQRRCCESVWARMFTLPMTQDKVHLLRNVEYHRLGSPATLIR